MTCIKCQHSRTKRFGYVGKQRIQRYRCLSCKTTFVEPHAKPLDGHYTPLDKVTQILNLMLEGMSVRAIERLTGVHRDTILDLMKTAARKARHVLDSRVWGISPRYVQLDELWGFVHTRDPHLNEGDPAEWGSVFTWLAIDSETKLIITHHLGGRNSVAAHKFVADLYGRTQGRYQITSDQLNAYVGAIREHYKTEVDFAQLHKIYGRLNPDSWYGGGEVVGAVPHVKIGRPEWNRISTSHVERTNLSVRMHCRRWTRLTNAHSKSFANMRLAVTLYCAWYNFCRPNQALGPIGKRTPAMAAGLTDHVWTIQELLSYSN